MKSSPPSAADCLSSPKRTPSFWFESALALFLGLGLATSVACAQTVAFPGAEGFGRFASGGRGGDVYVVTNLDDSGPGSLREGVTNRDVAIPRTVVFAVSGTIYLNSTLRITKGNLTIAGQTAPGDGICLAGYTLNPSNANNVIIRFIRSRLGDVNGVEDDAFMCRYATNMIVDHCSFSWSVDETSSSYDNTDFTMQWCLISESLRASAHSKGNHGYGGIWGGIGASYHHNLIAHHDSRNPRFNGARTHGTDGELVDMRNNVIYNWRGNTTYGGEPTDAGLPSRQNMINNTYKPGPATGTGAIRYRILEPTRNTASTGAVFGLFHVEGNRTTASATVSADNWAGGVQAVSAAELAALRAPEAFAVAPVATQSADEAYALVLAHAGVSHPARDSVDTRVLAEVASGTATHRGSVNNLPGIIDSQADVGGWPALASAPAPADGDADGMPDDWEIARGLDPQNPADRNLTDISGYTQLEIYLNGLVADAFPAPQIIAQPASVVVAAGEPFTLAVGAGGAAPHTYQWFKNGGTVPDATGASHTVAAAGADDIGAYTVRVTNAYGSIDSGEVTVDVVETDAAVLFATTFAGNTIHAAETTPTSSVANWYVMSSKNATGTSVGDDPATTDMVEARPLNLTMTLTSSGVVETAARFVAAPRALVAVGDTLRARIEFVPTNVRTLGLGFFNSGGVLPHTGLINGQLVGGSSTFATGGTQGWRGYRAVVANASALASLDARSAQSGLTNASQSLIVPGTSSSAPDVTGIGPVSPSADVMTFADDQPYTLTVTLTRADATSFTLACAIHAGGDTAAAPLFASSATTTETGTLPEDVVTAFDAIGIGYRNVGDASVSRLTVTSLRVSFESVVAPDAYAAFLANSGLDPAEADGADDADPDGDGVANAFEFIFGGDPLDPAAAPGPRIEPEDTGFVVFTFPRHNEAGALFTLAVERSADLVDWAEIMDGVGGVTLGQAPLDEEHELVTVRAPVEAPRMFFRLRATRR